MGKSRLPRRGIVLVLAAWVIAFAIVLLLPADAWGRAGGGGGYSGGGGHGGGSGGGGFHGGGGSGGGGSGGGGGGGLIYLLFAYPHIVLPVIALFVIYYFYTKRNSAGQQQEGAIATAAPPLDAVQRETAIARLRQHDPAFDEQAFFQRVAMAFMKIQAAWSAQDLAAVRPFISDGVHERFTLQFAEQRTQGWRDQMDNVQIGNISTAELRSDGFLDELSVRIQASANDRHVSLADGKSVGGADAPGGFVEVWSFLRRRGAVTQAGRAGLMEGQCPNCGAPIELNQSANCEHCKALLRSGEYDWVLSEITQAEEWQGAPHEELPGVTALRSRDADFNAVEMEDRTSVVFWRKATADRIGKIDPLRKVAAETFCEAYASVLRASPGHPRQYYGDFAVGSVDLRGVISDSKGDRAVVEVRWSAKLVAAAPGAPPRVLNPNHLAYSLFVLWRQPGTKTDAAKGISSAHCPGCGAPVSNSASAACEFCGAVLNDGAHGWILIAVLNRTDAAGQALLRELGAGMADG